MSKIRVNHSNRGENNNNNNDNFKTKFHEFIFKFSLFWDKDTFNLVTCDDPISLYKFLFS